MSIDLWSRADAIEISRPESESDLELPWAENVVTVAGTLITVLFVSSVAVVMYFA